MADRKRLFRVSLLRVNSVPVRKLPQDYLSFTIDTSLLLGGHWWGETRRMKKGVADNRVAPLELENARLVAYAKALGPAMLRVGGTEADKVGYKPGKKALASLGIEQNALAEGARHDFLLDKKQWKKLHVFLERTGLSLLFTLSAGPDDRDGNGAWKEDNAQRIMAYSAKKGYKVAAWELGNEVNGFPFIYGLKHRVDARQYAKDFARFGSLARKLSPESAIVGPSSAIWPRIGEPNPIIPGLCRSPAAAFLDAVSWHYYPQQSSHGRIATKRAGASSMLQPRALDAAAKMNARVLKAIERAKESRTNLLTVGNWVTETAHALYGGESGLSDGFVSTLWWLDELGLLAREGADKVFRQSLIGARYGLLGQTTFDPRPDYYASFLWKKLMGEEVLTLTMEEAPDRRLRAYMHRGTSGGKKAPAAERATMLLINLSRRHPAEVSFTGLSIQGQEQFLLQGEGGFQSQKLLLNGVRAADDLILAWGKQATREKYRINPDGGAPLTAGKVEVPPVSALFLSAPTTAPKEDAGG